VERPPEVDRVEPELLKEPRPEQDPAPGRVEVADQDHDAFEQVRHRLELVVVAEVGRLRRSDDAADERFDVVDASASEVGGWCAGGGDRPHAVEAHRHVGDPG
jgi:hypothetical protein